MCKPFFTGSTDDSQYYSATFFATLELQDKVVQLILKAEVSNEKKQ